MYERFTDDARRAFQAANSEATRLGHDYIGIEHILIGILAQPGIVADACKSLGVDPKTVSEAIWRAIDPTDERAKRISSKALIEEAIVDSSQRGHETIGADHLMLAILRAYAPSLHTAIEAAGLNRQNLRDELIRRNPAASTSRPRIDVLIEKFQHHPEVQLLDGQIVEIQSRQGDAIMRGDFESAARLRDEKVELKLRLEALLQWLSGEP